jgi:hypothetical protein
VVLRSGKEKPPKSVRNTFDIAVSAVITRANKKH